MPFDPAKPTDSSTLCAAEMRAQLTSLHSLIQAGAVTGAVVNNTNTLSPGTAATAEVTLAGGTLTFNFGIPAGAPGEVTQSQLNDGLAQAVSQSVNIMMTASAANVNGIGVLGQSAAVSCDPLQFQAALDKLDELISGLRR